jgi:hypothetical protein
MPEGTTVWRDQLTVDESTQLVRGAGVIAQPRPDVLVVGGGMVGGRHRRLLLPGRRGLGAAD